MDSWSRFGTCRTSDLLPSCSESFAAQTSVVLDVNSARLRREEQLWSLGAHCGGCCDRLEEHLWNVAAAVGK